MTQPRALDLRSLAMQVIREHGARLDGQGVALMTRRLEVLIPADQRTAAHFEMSAFYLRSLMKEERERRMQDARLRPQPAPGPVPPSPAAPDPEPEVTDEPVAPVIDLDDVRPPLPAEAPPEPAPLSDAPLPSAPISTGTLKQAWLQGGPCPAGELAERVARATGHPADVVLELACRSFITSWTRAPLEPVAGQKARASRQSWRIRGIRERWPDLLTASINGVGGEMALGDATEADLEHYADNIAQQIAPMVDKEKRARALRDDLLAHPEATRVRDLPDDILKKYADVGETQ